MAVREVLSIMCINSKQWSHNTSFPDDGDREVLRNIGVLIRTDAASCPGRFYHVVNYSLFLHAGSLLDSFSVLPPEFNGIPASCACTVEPFYYEWCGSDVSKDKVNLTYLFNLV
jgi:hypothetical protein